MSTTIIISLTTVPNRIKNLVPVLNSLINGNVKPTEIWVNVPEQHAFSKQYYSVPHNIKTYIKKHKEIKIKKTYDYGPITKLIPTVESIDDPDTFIVTVDDDHVYPDTFLEGLIEGYKQKECPCGYSGLYVDSIVMEELEHLVQVDVLEGYAGIIYKRGDFDENFKEYINECLKDGLLKWNDDIVVSNYMTLLEKGLYHLNTETCNRTEIINKKTNNIDELRKDKVYTAQLTNSYLVLLSNIWNGIHVKKREIIINKILELNTDLDINPDWLISDKSFSKPCDYISYVERIVRLNEKIKNQTIQVLVNYNTKKQNGNLFEFFENTRGLDVKPICLGVNTELLTKVKEKIDKDHDKPRVIDTTQEDTTEKEQGNPDVNVLVYYDNVEKTSLTRTQWIQNQKDDQILIIAPNNRVFSNYTLFELVEAFMNVQEDVRKNTVYGGQTQQTEELINIGDKEVSTLRIEGLIVGYAKSLKTIEESLVLKDSEVKKRCLFSRFVNSFFVQILN